MLYGTIVVTYRTCYGVLEIAMLLLLISKWLIKLDGRPSHSQLANRASVDWIIPHNTRSTFDLHQISIDQSSNSRWNTQVCLRLDKLKQDSTGKW